MKAKAIWFLLAVAVSLDFATFARAQDKITGNQPIDPTINPATLTYDYLVDGNLAQDDPANKKFKTLQAAYEAAQPGTEQKPTVIGIKPNVYQLPGGDRIPSMTIDKDWITFLGLTNNRRAVVLADNRGLSEGSSDDGFMLMVNCTGFTAKNLTMLNYCNCDYEYPGDPSKNLKMRNPTITQAVALQAQGDKHVYQNVALLSRLDTMFLRTTRSYFKNVYVEGTDDFIGGGQVSYWDDCDVVFPTGRGVMSASGIVFANTTFESTLGMQFYKFAARPVALIDCTVLKNAVSWVRGEAPPRPNLYSLTYHTKIADGKPAVITDGSEGPPAFTYSRELTDQEALAFNPWNVLRAPPTGSADDWDPSGTKDKYESAGQGSLVYRMALTNTSPSIRTHGHSAKIGATVQPSRVADATIKWSTPSNLITLSNSAGPSVEVTGNNLTDTPAYVSVTATAANGFFVTAWVFVEPPYTDPPAITAGPTLAPPADGKIQVDYKLDLRGKTDQSIISWYQCDDASGANPREVATSRGNQPLAQFTLTPGDVGKFIRVGIEPKHQLSDPGKAAFAIAERPITASDVPSTTVSPNFRNFVITPNTSTDTSFANGMWTALGTWTTATSPRLVNGYGLRVGSQGASLLYQQDASTGDMQIDLVMSPEKTAGSGFGSPGAPADGPRIQKSDVFIKYDPRTKNGYSLRIWRTTQSTEKCMFQFFKITSGAGQPLSDKQAFTGVFKPNTYLTLKVVGSTITATAHNDVDQETLSLQDTITPNTFGGAGVFWNGSIPRGNSNVYSLFKISYPTAPTTTP